MYKLKESIQDKNHHLRCPNYSGNYDRALIRLLNLNSGYKFERELAEPEVVMVCDGFLEITLDGADEYHIPSGKMFFLSPGTDIAIVAVESATILLLTIDISDQQCSHIVFSQLAQCKQDIISPFNLLEIRSCLGIFIHGIMPFLEDGLLCSAYLKAKNTEFMHILKCYYSPQEQAALFYPLLSEDMSFSNFIARNINKVKSIEEFAKLTNMSRSGFIDKFKRKMGGQSPAVYIKKHRLELIRKDLLNRELPLKEVAIRNGYEHYEVFSKFCRKNLGFNPSDLRKPYKTLQNEGNNSDNHQKH